MGKVQEAPATDIEGSVRPCGAGVDIGADEAGGCASGLPFVRGDSTADAEVNIVGPLFLLLYLFPGGPAPEGLRVADSNDNGDLDISSAVHPLIHLFVGDAVIPTRTRSAGWIGHPTTSRARSTCPAAESLFR